ncbi:MAG: site-specific integrase, partial [Clostridiales bacterium]|nr:site-specific integrase [Clostridiales bacterium]
MSKPNWNEKRQRWVLTVYENRKCVHTFTSTKKGKAGYNECLSKRSAWLGGAKDHLVTTVNSQWDRFLEDAAQRYQPEGVKRLDCDYRNYIKPALGTRKLTSVTANDWQSCLNNARKRDGTLLSEKSVKTIRNTLAEFLKYCKKDGLDVPSSDDLYIPKTVKPVKEKVILTEEHMAAFFDDSQPFANQYYVPYWRFALATGLRPGEILGLRYEDYDGTFCVVKRSINTHKNIRPGGKTKNAARKIALSELAKAAIEKQIAQTADLHSEYIFCRPDGGIASSAKINLRFKKVCKTIGAPEDISLYGCRHTFISYASRVLSESVLKPLVGHSVSMPTLTTYQHTTDQMLKDAAKA